MENCTHLNDSNFEMAMFQRLHELLGSVIETYKFKKLEELLPRAADSCIYFMKSGLAHSFYINEMGKRSTFCFIEAGQFFVLVYPFLKTPPVVSNIQFLEKSTVYAVGLDDMQLYYSEYPELNFITRLLAEKAWFVSENRSLLLRVPTADKRYEAFKHDFPLIAQKVALIHIASYLNMAPETLSRLRSSKIS